VYTHASCSLFRNIKRINSGIKTHMCWHAASHKLKHECLAFCRVLHAYKRRKCIMLSTAAVTQVFCELRSECRVWTWNYYYYYYYYYYILVI